MRDPGATRASLEELVRALEEQRISLENSRSAALEELKDLQVLGQALWQREAQRLARKLGDAHPHVRQAEARRQRNAGFVVELEGDLEIGSIRVPEVPMGGALVHGRVTDEARRGIAKLTVFGQDRDRRAIAAFGQTETDASGYFAIACNSDAIEGLETTEVFVAVSTGAGTLLHCEPKPIVLASGSEILVEVLLDRATIGSPGELSPSEPYDTRSGETSREPRTTRLEDLNGVGPSTANKLREAGITDIPAFSRAEDATLERILGRANLARIRAQNRALLRQ